MKTMNRSSNCSALLPAVWWVGLCLPALLLTLAFAANGAGDGALPAQGSTISGHATAAAGDGRRAAPIPLDQIGAVAQKQYSGDGLSVTATEDGALLRCVFQRMTARATTEGLWITSTADGATGEPFRVKAVAVGRGVNPGARTIVSAPAKAKGGQQRC